MVIGRNISSPPEYVCDYHKKMINVRKFSNFVIKHSSNQAIMNIQNLPCINTSAASVALITSGANIWAANTYPTLNAFKHLYLHEYAALTINNRFVEQGVKESGYAALGRRGEANRTVLAIARGKILPEALQNGKDSLNDDNDNVSKNK